MVSKIFCTDILYKKYPDMADFQSQACIVSSICTISAPRQHDVEFVAIMVC